MGQNHSWMRTFVSEAEGHDHFADGRNFGEQISDVLKYGSHATANIIRELQMKNLGLPDRKTKAQYGVIFGCYKPFTAPELIRDYMNLFARLGTDVTWFAKEYCCGYPLVETDPEKYMAVSGAFAEKNLQLADEIHAEALVYCCIGCAYAVRHSVPDQLHRNIYAPELLKDLLSGSKLSVKAGRIGYFEGCHAWYRKNYPNGKVDWGGCRELISNIEGLEVVDVPKGLCCKRTPEKIREFLRENNINCVVCPCNSCYEHIRDLLKEEMEVITYPGLILAALPSDSDCADRR